MDPTQARLAEAGLRAAAATASPWPAVPLSRLTESWNGRARTLTCSPPGNAATSSPRQQADAGFDRHILADLFGMLRRYPDRRFAAYGATAEQVTAMRSRFADWRSELLSDQA